MRFKTPNPKRSRLRLSLPATSANLGPAFDAAAVAMDFYIKIDARPAEEFAITASGRDYEICGKVENHLILNTYREVLQAAGRPLAPLSLKIANEIPIGKGCGSSAAARLAGIAMAVHFGGLRWTDTQIVGEASRREDHPDNASACWWGGLTVARMSEVLEDGLTEEGLTEDGLPVVGLTAEPAAVQGVCIRPTGQWPLLLDV